MKLPARSVPSRWGAAGPILPPNDRREEADYNHDAVFTRPDTRDLILLANEVVAAIKRTQSTQSQQFFGLIAMKANVRQRQ